jgi:hypothetical protein
MQRSMWIMGAATLGLCIGSAAPAADDGGWTVRICRGQTEASAIKISVGDGKTTKELINWQSDNQVTNFPVPAPLATADKLMVKADSEPGDGKVTMCILQGRVPAKTMKFTDLLEATAAKGDTDESCPCK